tara:strand:+ start:14616 stop:15212 length:597 start_codon:yes stop_codon:yes gene_type:complete
MPNVLEYYVPQSFRTETEVENKDIRDQNRQLLYSLDLTSSGSPIQEPQIDNNLITLSGGEYGGAVLERDATLLRGGTGSSSVVGKIEVHANAVIDGIYFDSSNTNHTEHVVVGRKDSPVKAVIRNCTFNKNKGLDTSVMVSVAEGSQAIIIGCIFKGGPGTASPVLNDPANAAGDVQVIGSLNLTGSAFVNVTSTGTL